MMIRSNENMFVCFLVLLVLIPDHLMATLFTIMIIFITYFHGIFQKIDDAGPQPFTPKTKNNNLFWILFSIVLALLMEFNGISMNIFDFADEEGQSFKISKIISEVTT